MARKGLVRSAAVSGVVFVALASGAGIASAAPYGGVSAAGVTTSGGGTATFTGSGYEPGTTVLLTVTSCGTSKAYSAIAAGSNGSIAVATTGAGQTDYSATGTDGTGQTLTLTSSALLSNACASTVAIGGNGGTGTGTGTGTGALPFTGFEVGTAAAIGFAAIGTGLVIVGASRRRRRGEATS
jgi:hypothetical protein